MAKLSTTSVFGDLLVDGMIHGNVTGNLTGNASTATTATTATTAGKWSTARTITIGSKGKSVDGSANVSWSLAEIGAAATSHTHTIANITDLRIKNVASSVTTSAPVATWANSSIKNNDIIFGGDYKTTTANSNIIFSSNTGVVNMVIDGEFYANEGQNKVYHAGNKPTPADIGAAASSHGTHVTYSTTAPLVAGTAAIGSANNVARGDHVHPAQTSVSGNAGTATTLQTARNIALGGLLSGSASFNGSANITINASVAKPPKSGDWFSGGIPIVNTDGVMEIGKYIDFHNTDTSTNDYDVRLQANTSTPCVITLPSGAGTLARTSDNITGNAATATSAGKWTTARTLTIGNTGKSVDGSANVSWSLSEIGAFPVAGGTLTGPITGETRFVGGNLTYSDPWTSVACALKVTGKIACTDTIKAPTFEGNATSASSATKLATARTVTVNGVVKGSCSFDGSANVTITTSANDITSINKSLTVGTEWMDTGITGSNLSTGTYAVQMFANCQGTGGLWTEYFSGIMSWYASGVNSPEADEIVLHKAGHAPNGQHIYLRTKRNNQGSLVLQIAAKNAITAAINFEFKFKKLI